MNEFLKQKTIELKVKDRTRIYVDSGKNLNDIAPSLDDKSMVILSQGNDSSKNFLDYAKQLQQLCAEFGTTLVIKDRCDIAFLIDAEVIMLDEGSIDKASAQKILGDRIIIIKK